MRLSVSTKVFLGFAVVITTFGLVSVYSILKMISLRGSIRFIRAGVMSASEALKDIDNDLGGYDEVLGSRSPIDIDWLLEFLPSLRPFDRVDAVATRIATLAERPDLRSEDREVLRRLGQRLSHIGRENQYQQPLLANVHSEALRTLAPARGRILSDRQLYEDVSQIVVLHASSGDVATATEAQGLLKHLIRRVKKEVAGLARELRKAVDLAYEQAEQQEDRAILAVILVTVVAVVMSLATMVLAALALRPIRDLRAGAQQVARGDYSRRIDVATGDEIGQLAGEFNRMAESLQARDRLLAQQRDELVQSERLATVGRMAAHIAHEIRNPLSSIGLNLELLEEELATVRTGGSSEIRDLLQSIAREVDRLGGVTAQYLRVARKPRQALAPTDLSALLRDLLAFMQPQWNVAQIAVDLSIDDLPLVQADGNQLRQAFLNILRNAQEAMPSGGSLSVCARPHESEVEVEIRDTGSGMVPEVQARIFEPFFTTKAEGTGLGLALTHQLIGAMNGRIECQSEPNRGTTFLVWLPTARPEAAVDSAATEA